MSGKFSKLGTLNYNDSNPRDNIVPVIKRTTTGHYFSSILPTIMISRPDFNEIIKDILGNLYDITALENHPAVFSGFNLPAGYSGHKGEYIRQLFLDAIEQLRSSRKEFSPTSPEWRSYLIIHKRYVEGMGIQQLSELLAISQRQMRRDHHKAVQTLTDILWADLPKDEAENIPPEQSPIFEGHNEIIDPVETLKGVFSLLKPQFEEKNISVSLIHQEVIPPLVTDRVILRQVLISLFNEILHNQLEKTLQIKFSMVENQVQIIFSSQAAAGIEPAGDESADDSMTTVNYWCNRINARIEEKVIEDANKLQIIRILWLSQADQKILLVIDDQEAVVNLFKRYLSQSGILAVGVSHPEQAIALAHTLRPAVITLDVMMPQMDGWELLQMIKLDETLSQIPVIVCSAWDDPDLSQSLGATAYLKKPVTQKMLLQALEKLTPLTAY